MTSPHGGLAEVKARIDELEATFRHIATTRMAGVPVLHSALQVRAVGFAPQPDAPGWLCGVLVTPWFMNLLRLPLKRLDGVAQARAADCLDVGRDVERELGGQPLHFVGAHEVRLGHFEQCSLFSPMFHFADQAAAVATAMEVLKLLRQPTAPATTAPAVPLAATPACAAQAPQTAPGSSPAAPPPVLEPRLGRRGFLFGRVG